MAEGTNFLAYNTRTGQPLPVRMQLTADRTYYVRSNGSDSNPGLVNTAAGAFLTIQKAINTVRMLDLNTHSVTIRVSDGTYSSFLLFGPFLGGRVTLLGNTTTPANCIIHATDAETAAVALDASAVLDIGGFSVLADDDAAVKAEFFSALTFVGNMQFGATANGPHISANQDGRVFSDGNAFEIIGSAQKHLNSENGGVINTFSNTVTLTGTPNFTSQFAFASRTGLILAGDTYVGAATGQRFLVEFNGVIDVGGAGVNYFPGDVAGATATGGQYA